MKFNGIHQLLVCSDAVKLLGDNVLHTIKKNREALLVAGKEIGLEVNADKSKHMFMSCEQGTGQNWNIKIGN
jgi:hypothetical protein